MREAGRGVRGAGGCGGGGGGGVGGGHERRETRAEREERSGGVRRGEERRGGHGFTVDVGCILGEKETGVCGRHMDVGSTYWVGFT